MYWVCVLAATSDLVSMLVGRLVAWDPDAVTNSGAHPLQVYNSAERVSADEALLQPYNDFDIVFKPPNPAGFHQHRRVCSLPLVGRSMTLC